MNRILSAALVSITVTFASPAWAEMPQTDVALVEQLSAKSPEDVLKALEVYYTLHVSEIDVQLTTEQNTGAFFAARRAEADGDKAEVERQMAAFEGTKAALAAAKKVNQGLRQKLAAMTAISFGDDLHMAPEAPDTLPAAPAGAPTALLAARTDAWQRVESARKTWGEMRLKLLEDQEQYDKTRTVKIGDSMRAMTKAEVALARAACDFRLLEARIAIATGKPLVSVLGGL